MLKNLERSPITHSFKDPPFTEHFFILNVFFLIRDNRLFLPLWLHVFLNQFGILNFYPFTIITRFMFTWVGLHWKRFSISWDLHLSIYFETFHLLRNCVDLIKAHKLLGLWGFLYFFNCFWELCFLVWLEAEFSSRTLAAGFIASKRKLRSLFRWLQHRWSHCSTCRRYEGRVKSGSLEEGFFIRSRWSSESVFVLAHLH